MPLHIDIKINTKLLRTITVGRLEPLEVDRDEYEYVVFETYPRSMSADRVHFKHNYSDGAEVCARKALEALEAK